MKQLWNSNIPFPTLAEMYPLTNAKHVTLHTATENGSHFLLGAAIIKHKGTFYSSWANSLIAENDDHTILAERRSTDQGNSWGELHTVADSCNGVGRSHGVYFPWNGNLYVFCPRANYVENSAEAKTEKYPGLKMEGYVLNTAGGYDCLGTVLDADFWPMCQPIVLNDGSLLMAGLETDYVQGAVALCDGKDLTKWEMKVIPNPENYQYWGETTVLAYPDRLLAVVRGGDGLIDALISESFDNGKTWSGLRKSNLPASYSKMYGGQLSNGLYYLFFTPRTDAYRDTLALAIGKDSLEKIYVVRHGFDAPPRFQRENEWCYPYAFEDTETQKLYVVYAHNKENCEMTIIPLEDLTL